MSFVCLKIFQIPNSAIENKGIVEFFSRSSIQFIFLYQYRIAPDHISIWGAHMCFSPSGLSSEPAKKYEQRGQYNDIS